MRVSKFPRTRRLDNPCRAPLTLIEAKSGGDLRAGDATGLEDNHGWI